MMIGFPPGGGTDIVGRIVANKLSEDLGKAVTPDNRGGAAGSIGILLKDDGVVRRDDPFCRVRHDSRPRILTDEALHLVLVGEDVVRGVAHGSCPSRDV